MAGIFDNIADELSNIIGEGFNSLLVDLIPDPDESLFRKFRENYDKMDVAGLQTVIGASGHTENEDPPCRVCKMMASKTIEMSED